VTVRKLTFVVGGIVLATVVLWLLIGARGSGDENSLSTVRVERGSVVHTVTADGTLQPKTTVNVKSYAGGNVDVLAVEVGDVVKKGDLIAKIDPTDSLSAYEQATADLDAAKARLGQARDQAEAQPAMTKAAIAQAEASYTSAAQNLDYIREAKHPQLRASAQSSLDKAKANLDLADIELQRMKQLKDQGFVPQSDVDTARNRRDLAAAELGSTQEQWDTLERQLDTELKSAQAQLAQSKASLDKAKLDAVQDRIRTADVTSADASVARAQAQVTNAKTTLGYTTIVAPRDGVILDKYVEEGTIVTSGRSSVTEGTDVVLLGDLTEMFVEVSLDEADVGMIQVGHQTNVTVDAFPEEVFKGTVARVDPQALTQQNVTTVLVTVRLSKPDPRLKPGMTATCEFIIGHKEDVLRLPNVAVQEKQGEHSVFVLRTGQPMDTPVEIGVVGDNFTEILSGVDEGTEVVLQFSIGSSERSESRGREMGRRMGGAGGLVRSN